MLKLLMIVLEKCRFCCDKIVQEIISVQFHPPLQLLLVDVVD